MNLSDAVSTFVSTLKGGKESLIAAKGNYKDSSLRSEIIHFLDIDTLGKSSQTRLWYEARLRLLEKFLGGGRSIQSISETDLLGWYRHLADSDISTDTRHGYIRATRKFFKFLLDRKTLSRNLARDLKLPRLPKRARKGIADEDVSAMLSAAQDDKRDYALLLFLESTNARREGVANLRMSDLSLDLPEPLCRRVILYEKGSKDRVAVMSHEALSALKEWLAVRGTCNSSFVFTAKRKHTGLTVAGVSEILDRYKIKIGIDGRCSPHQWRHRWCRKRLQDGMPLAQVSQLAGHASITVTADFYGTFAINELHEAFDRYYKPPERLDITKK